MNNGQSARTFAPEVSGCLTDPSLQSLESLPHRILAIDDSPNYLAVLLKELRNHGYEVVGAGSGTEGLARLGNERFDCALVDLAISYGIVEDHGGSIEVHSHERVGTEFVVKIP